MNKTLRNALIAAVAVVVLVLLLPYLVPLDAFRGRIEAAGGSAVGRTVRIEGPLRLMFFPHLGLRAQQVTLANVPGGRTASMVSVGDIALSVGVLPLLSGHLALDKIVLNKPTIALEVDAQGKGNWQFARTAKKRSGGGLPSETELAGIEVSDGLVTYDNAKTHTHRVVDHVNAEIALTKLDEPMAVNGDLMIGDRKVDFTAHLATLKTFLGSGNTTIDVAAKAELMNASFKGQMTPDGETSGVFALDTPSFRSMAGWLGEELPGGGLGPMALQGHMANKDKLTRFDSLRLVLDRQTITGVLSIDSRPKVPVIDGDLKADHLDLNPYLSAHGAAETAQKETGWSRKPISLGLIKTFDGKLSLSTGALRLRGLHLGLTTLKLETRSGVMTVWLNPISLYGGNGEAMLAIDANGDVPQFRNTLAFKNVSLNPFLTDTLGVTSLEGAGALTLDVSSQGDSAFAIMRNLTGKGVIAGNNGRFRGIDMGEIARTIESFAGGNTTGKFASTDFHAMGGSFVIAQGVLSNSDFHLDGPVVRMTGSGRIDLGNRNIDFRIQPSAAVAGMKVGVPFRIKGSWDRVHYTPDFADMIGGVVKGLFGSGQQNGQKKKSVGDTLKDMFGIH